MEIIVHYPKDKHDLDTLKKQVAIIHGEYIYSYIQKLDCSKEQKQSLIDSIKSVL